MKHSPSTDQPSQEERRYLSIYKTIIETIMGCAGYWNYLAGYPAILSFILNNKNHFQQSEKLKKNIISKVFGTIAIS